MPVFLEMLHLNPDMFCCPHASLMLNPCGEVDHYNSTLLISNYAASDTMMNLLL